MQSLQEESDKRFSATDDYTKLTEYDYSMKIAPALSQLRYAIAPGTAKKFNNMLLKKNIKKVTETQKQNMYTPSYATQAPLAKISYNGNNDFDYDRYI